MGEELIGSSLQVRETLRYAAALRMRGASSVEQSARAEEVLRMLGLKLCADNLVGGEVRFLPSDRKFR